MDFFFARTRRHFRVVPRVSRRVMRPTELVSRRAAVVQAVLALSPTFLAPAPARSLEPSKEQVLVAKRAFEAFDQRQLPSREWPEKPAKNGKSPFKHSTPRKNACLRTKARGRHSVRVDRQEGSLRQVAGASR